MAIKHQNNESSYWDERINLIYYEYVRILVRGLAHDSKSLIDVGSNETPLIEEFDWIPTRNSLDIEKPYSSDNVLGIKADFFDFKPQTKYDFLTCLQVLEHVPDPTRFAHKLLETSDRVLVSLPYKWKENSCKEHLHDPVDLEKIVNWFGRKPTYYVIVDEPLYVSENNKNQRIICYFYPEKRRIGFYTSRKRAYSNERFNINSLRKLIDEEKDTTGILRSQLEDVREQLDYTRRCVEDSADNLDNVISTIKYFLEISRNRNEFLKRNIDNMKRKIHDEINKGKKIERKLSHYEKISYEIENSNTWRMTKVLRDIKDRLK
ncbi:hypothetical protein IDH44_12040 [Paenibacillus sp. IB182496]|uniref:Methyltransferase family protein n=1 Tax=Paenibacillus sabuli TaxID=2772509 RepID=A0A927GSD9_9BACL|nr:methyltransferase domain-containing protein [Paenibacillus sabuli]MBD2845925.1 hypothetical protein [Paenibacillus sabuli]